MRKVLPVLLCIALVACNQEKELLTPDDAVNIELSHDQQSIDNFITSKIQKGNIFDWVSASDEMIHSAAMLSDKILAIGYQPKDSGVDEDVIGTTDKLPNEWLALRDETLDKVLAEERRMTGDPKLALADILPFGLDDEIPTIAVQVTSLRTVTALRSQETIRYVEPMGYEYTAATAKSSAGCGSQPNYNIRSYDYSQTSSYNAKIPWNFN